MSLLWLILLLPAALLGYRYFRPGRQQKELGFWLRICGTLADKRGPALEAAVALRCSELHKHPVHGEISLKPDRVLRELNRLRRTQPVLLERAARRYARKAANPHGRVRVDLSVMSQEEIRNELFWFQILGPLAELADNEADRRLRSLTGRALVHPTDGKRYYDLPTLRSRLARVRTLDPSGAAFAGRA